MTDKQVALRLENDWVDRAEALMAPIAADPRFEAFGKIKRATVLKMAIGRGLRELEQEYLDLTERGA